MRWSLFGTKPRQSGVTRVEVVKTYWRLIGPTRRPVACALYRTDAGLELRTYRDTHDLLYSLPVSTENQGADQAEAWKTAALTFAGFSDAEVKPAGTTRTSAPSAWRP
jgi:hypothetical protein